jgi:hypothetical protein
VFIFHAKILILINRKLFIQVILHRKIKQVALCNVSLIFLRKKQRVSCEGDGVGYLYRENLCLEINETEEYIEGKKT